MNPDTKIDELEKKSTEKTSKQTSVRKKAGRSLTLKEKIEDNLVLFTLSILIGGFIAGLGTYKGVLEIAQLESISKQEVERLRKNSPTVSVLSKDRTIPKNIPLRKIETKSSWMASFIHLLDIEGAFKKQDMQTISADQSDDKKNGFHFGTDALDYEVIEPTKSFNWILTADTQYSLAGLGFRFNAIEKYFEPLDVETTETGDKITFRVPQCEKGDKLIAILRVESTEEMNMTDITSAFQSSSK